MLIVPSIVPSIVPPIPPPMLGGETPRDPAAWPDLPWQAESVPQLGPGRPGKDGRIELCLGRGDRIGRTVIRSLRHQPPLQMGRLLHPDPACPEIGYCYLAMLTGGLVQGDRLHVRIALEPGARAHVTTLSATKVYGMERNGAAQRVELTCGPGSFLEWWPDPVIPFRGARFWQEVGLTVDPDAHLLYGDLVLPGRVTAGEQHDYAFYRSRVTARSPDGRRLFVDTQALAPPPAGAGPIRTTLPSDRQVVGTVYVLTRSPALPALLDKLRRRLAASATVGTVGGDGIRGVLAGCSLLPAGCGIVVRFLACDGPAGRAAMAAMQAGVRQHLLGVDAPLACSTRKC
ncbi:MAG: urease accessory protein UreD [Chloroflexi bacterium]|nr:urease accessory protein UreD [Chloroflexota bacterium]